MFLETRYTWIVNKGALTDQDSRNAPSVVDSL